MGIGKSEFGMELKVGPATEKQQEVPNRVASENTSTRWQDQIPQSLRKSQNGGMVSGPQRKNAAFIGKNQEESQSHKTQKGFQNLSSPGASQPIRDQIYPEVSPFSPQYCCAEEDHPGKGKFNDFICPTHGTNGYKPDEYPGREEYEQSYQASDTAPFQGENQGPFSLFQGVPYHLRVSFLNAQLP